MSIFFAMLVTAEEADMPVTEQSREDHVTVDLHARDGSADQPRP